MIQRAGLKLQEKVLDKKLHPFDAWNELQPHLLGKLGRSFGELFIATNLLRKIQEIKNPINKNVMNQVLSLYLVTRVVNDSGRF